METMEAMYRLVREYESKSIIRRVDTDNVNLHVACGKGIIVVINLIEFKTSTGAESVSIRGFVLFIKCVGFCM